jgi:hypothetical protein
MPPLVRGAVFAILGALVVFKLVRAAQSGEILSAFGLMADPIIAAKAFFKGTY